VLPNQKPAAAIRVDDVANYQKSGYGLCVPKTLSDDDFGFAR